MKSFFDSPLFESPRLLHGIYLVSAIGRVAIHSIGFAMVMVPTILFWVAILVAATVPFSAWPPLETLDFTAASGSAFTQVIGQLFFATFVTRLVPLLDTVSWSRSAFLGRIDWEVRGE